MDLNELWVGDKVRIKSNLKIGIFQGIKDGKARIKIGKDTLFCHSDDLMLFEDYGEDFSNLDFLDEATKSESIVDEKLKFNDTIDLHIEKLKPSYLNRSSAEILNEQLNQCNKFISKALELRFNRVTIIHGRGKGVLKQSVKDLLEGQKRVSVIHEINNGGAFEVWLK